MTQQFLGELSYNTMYLMDAKQFATLATVIGSSTPITNEYFYDENGDYNTAIVLNETQPMKASLNLKRVLTRAEFKVIKEQSDIQRQAMEDAKKEGTVTDAN